MSSSSKTAGFIVTVLACLLCSQVPAFGQEPKSSFHDWTIRIGYTRFGVRGDSEISCIMYGSGCTWVQLSCWSLVAFTSLPTLAVAGLVICGVRRLTTSAD